VSPPSWLIEQFGERFHAIASQFRTQNDIVVKIGWLGSSHIESISYQA